MAKPLTSYTKSSAAAAAVTWLLNSTTVLLNSTTAFLNGYFTSSAPNQLSNKPTTAFTKAVKPLTSFARNASVLVGITAGDLIVKANSATVQATGYTTTVPNMLGNKPLTAYTAV